MRAPAMQPDFYVDDDRPHLGGYIVGGDPATYYPQLWEWLVCEHDVGSVIDVGCGEGRAIDFFREELGISVLGVDGVPQGKASIAVHDFTTGPFVPPMKADLVWSCEFVEHVEEQYVPNFLETFKLGKLVAMTHAEPGQPGHHHVNCRTADYWIGALAAVDFRFDTETTVRARMMAAMNPNPINHFARSGLIFRRA